MGCWHRQCSETSTRCWFPACYRPSGWHVRRQRLVDPTSLHSVQLQPAKMSAVHLLQADRLKYDQLLARFPSLTTPAFSTDQVKHGVSHHIVMKGPPVTARARRFPPHKLAMAKAEFKRMADMGIVRRSASQFSSPLHLVDKSDGSKRPCGDFRRLNESTIPDRYPVLHIQDFSANLAGKSAFSKVDLVRGYYQVPMAPEDIPKMAIITPFGLWEFTRMPFGLKNAAQTFQRLMDTVCADLDFAFVYLDDILMSQALRRPSITTTIRNFSNNWRPMIWPLTPLSVFSGRPRLTF